MTMAMAPTSGGLAQRRGGAWGEGGGRGVFSL